MLLSQRHHGQMNRGKFPLHFKGYLLYTAATQNTKWYSLTLEWMLKEDFYYQLIKQTQNKVGNSAPQLHMVGQVLIQKLLTIQDCNGWTNGPTNLLTYRPTQQGVVTYLQLKICRDQNFLSISSGFPLHLDSVAGCYGANHLINRGTD